MFLVDVAGASYMNLCCFSKALTRHLWFVALIGLNQNSADGWTVPSNSPAMSGFNWKAALVRYSPHLLHLLIVVV